MYPNQLNDMNSCGKVIEWVEPMAKFKKAKCFLWLMALDGLPSLWPEFLLHPPFIQVLDLLLLHLQPHSKSGLFIIELSYLLKPSHFNMSMSVKTVGHLSNKMFDNAEFLMTMHVYEEQLSHFLVF